MDENKQNNAPGNLVACQDSAYHSLLHRRAAALRACGDASAVRCQYCGEYARQSELMRHKQGKRVRFCHADCSRSKNRQYASKRRRQATSHEVGSLVGSPYDPAYAPALWGSMWGPDMNGQPRPQGKPEDIPTETIYRKPKNV